MTPDLAELDFTWELTGGTEATVVRQRERSMAAMVTPTNGAWLISWTGPLSEDLPDNDKFDAASSLIVAKRVAREGALSLGYSGAPRWERVPYGWLLNLYCDEEDS